MHKSLFILICTICMAFSLTDDSKDNATALLENETEPKEVENVTSSAYIEESTAADSGSDESTRMITDMDVGGTDGTGSAFTIREENADSIGNLSGVINDNIMKMSEHEREPNAVGHDRSSFKNGVVIVADKTMKDRKNYLTTENSVKDINGTDSTTKLHAKHTDKFGYRKAIRNGNVKNIFYYRQPSRNQTKVPYREYPYVAAIFDDESIVRCTATIVSEHWSLTARSCIRNYIVANKIRYINANNRYPHYTGTIVDITKLYTHPEYRRFDADDGNSYIENDLGMIFTKEALKISTPYPKLYTAMPFFKDSGVTVYSFDTEYAFGHIEEGTLRKTYLSISSSIAGRCKPCIVAVPPKVSDLQDHRDIVCDIDLGGPALLMGELIGFINYHVVIKENDYVDCGIYVSSTISSLQCNVEMILETLSGGYFGPKMLELERSHITDRDIFIHG